MGRPSDAFCSGSPKSSLSRINQNPLRCPSSQGRYSDAAKTVEPQSRGEGDDFYNLSPSLTQGPKGLTTAAARGDNSIWQKVRAAACLGPLPSLSQIKVSISRHSGECCNHSGCGRGINVCVLLLVGFSPGTWDMVFVRLCSPSSVTLVLVCDLLNVPLSMA